MKSYFLNKRNIIFRHVIILAMSLLFGLLSLAKEHQSDHELKDFTDHMMKLLLYITLLWNATLAVGELINRKYSWETKPYTKLAMFALLSISMPIVVHYSCEWVIFPFFNMFGFKCEMHKETILYFIISISITLLVNSILIGIEFFDSWKRSLVEKEQLKRESIAAEFTTLKNQVNPHFLFNSLNTLTSLIEENAPLATEYVMKMSSVYRYVLSQRDKETVALGEELHFIQSYIYLNKIRFGNNLLIHIHVPVSYHDKKIATLSLQMLLENAIKHNIISTQKPLSITIGIADGKVFVRNNLQRKTRMDDSNGIGLSNIVHRYSFLTKDEVEIIDDGEIFMVSLPLIAQS